MTLTAMKGQHTGDFWEHNAVVRELATNPFSPVNPLLSVDSPHAFYSPYSLSVALFSRYTGLSTITSLSVAGIFNLILFLISFKLFISLISGYKPAAFYSLIFVLLLWGPYPWYFSGFYNLDSLKFLLPYPSFFSGGLTFLTLSLLIVAFNKKKYVLFVPVMFGILLVLLSHPFTFIVLMTCIIAISLSKFRISIKEIILLSSATAGAFMLAGLWPYFPFYEFLFKEAGVYHISNKIMYEDILIRIYPALLAIPLLIIRFKSDNRDPLVLMFTGLTAIYIYGAVINNWGYGRVISYIIVILQITLGIYAANVEANLRTRKIRPYRAKLLYLTMILVLIIPVSYSPVINTLWLSFHKIKDNYSQYYFLTKYTKQYDIILSDLDTSWYVPSFGGKIVASPKPIAFVHDNSERRSAINKFFNVNTSVSSKIAIVQKYSVNYLLLNKNTYPAWPSTLKMFEGYAKIGYQDTNFVLMKINKAALANTHL